MEEALIGIVVVFILFFIAYKLIRRLIASDFRKSIISGELKEETSKMTIKIRDWFTWNVQVNNEKGTAGGNIKINFPIKSAFLIAIICIVIALLANASGVSLIVVLIFLSFAVYHFRRWYKTLKIISVHETFKNIKRLTRSSKNKYIAGVSVGIHQYYHISLPLTRSIFILLAFLGGLGVYIYILLWIILPTGASVPTQIIK